MSIRGVMKSPVAEHHYVLLLFESECFKLFLLMINQYTSTGFKRGMEYPDINSGRRSSSAGCQHQHHGISHERCITLERRSEKRVEIHG